MRTDPARHLRPVVLLATVLALALGAGACSDDADGDGDGAAAPTTTAAPVAGAYAEPGPFEVGVRTLELTDGNLVEVWYPAADGSTDGATPDTYAISDWLPAGVQAQVPDGIDDYETGAVRDVPVHGDGPFPVVLFSHGFASFRTQSSFLTQHLASWGMVVAAPDHPSRGLLAVFTGQQPDPTASLDDVRAAVTLLEDEATVADGPLQGALDLDRMAIVGHSAGGGTALLVAADGDLGPRLAMYVSLASGAQEGGPLPDVPSVFMYGTEDDIVEPERTTGAYERAPAPKRLYAFTGAGHLAFADICEIGSGRGGVLGIADALGIEIPDNLRSLATDGCTPEEVPPPDTWPAIRHFTTANLRVAFGADDASDVELTDTSPFAPLEIDVDEE
jgi:dienelactone hydrolase